MMNLWIKFRWKLFDHRVYKWYMQQLEMLKFMIDVVYGLCVGGTRRNCAHVKFRISRMMYAEKYLPSLTFITERG